MENRQQQEGNVKEFPNERKGSGRRGPKKSSHHGSYHDVAKEESGRKTFGGPGNDFAWWNKYPELLKDAVTIPNNYLAGEVLDAANHIIARLPGVLQVRYTPMYGAEISATDPINTWARELMLKIANKYRSLPYSGCDIAMVVIAGCEVLREIMETERVLGVIRRWSVTNTNYPYAVMCALGIGNQNADRLRKMYVTVRNDLNTLIERAKKIFIFKDMSLVANIISLSAYLYLDHDNSKASQVIAFTTNKYGIYRDTDLTYGGAVEFSRSLDRFDLSVVEEDPFATTLPRLSAMIDALVNSDGAQRIYRDLVAFFGEDAFLKFNYLPEDYQVIPVYSESILHKLHNVDPIIQAGSVNSIIPSGATQAMIDKLLGKQWVYQHDGVIISRCTLGNSSGIKYLSVSADNGFKFALDNSQMFLVPDTNGTTLLDTYHESPSEEIVTEGLMWKSVIVKSLAKIHPADADITVPAFEIQGCAFEMINEFYLFLANAVDSDDYVAEGMNFGTSYNFAADMACIDWAPLHYAIDGVNTAKVSDILGDYDNILVVSPTIKARTFRAVLLSGLKTEVQLLAQAK